MKFLWGFAAWAMVLSCLANDQEIQRALIQRDQQSAEFAASVRGGDRASLEALHARGVLVEQIPQIGSGLMSCGDSEKHRKPPVRLERRDV